MVARVVFAVALGLPGQSHAQAPAETPNLDQFREEAQQLVGKDVAVCNVATVRSRAIPGLFVASLDMSGRRFCNEVAVIRPGPPPTVIASIGAWELDLVGEAVRDLDGDGDDELVVADSMSSYQGAMACVATFPRVHRCTSHGCSDVSRRFASFYEQQRTRLNDALAADRRKAGRPEYDPRRRPCLEMEIEKIGRFLGDGPEPGMALARRWIADPDVYLRRKAVEIFADIGTSTALSELQRLTHDSDFEVAMTAQGRLAPRKPRPAP